MEIDSIIDEIVKSTDKSLSKNEQIRYVYISLGKKLSVNVDFFFSISNKLENKNYSPEKIKEIYNQKEYTKFVICKSCSEILKIIFDKLGINSKIVRTIKKAHTEEMNLDFDLQHHFIACEGDDNKIYFLTLSADLGNIQMGYQTQHFANNISYIDNDGQQVYEGEKINNSVLPFSELRKIDEKIKYLDTYYSTSNKNETPMLDYKNRDLELVKNAYNSNFDQYKLHLVENYDNPFYKKAQKVKFKNGHTEELSNLNKEELKKINLPYWKKKLALLVNNKINKEIGFKIPENKKQRYSILLKNNNIDMWLDEILQEMKTLGNNNSFDINSFNPIILTSRLKSLFTEMAKENLNVRSISKNIDLISLQFVDSKLLNEKDKPLTNYYIAKKFITEMPRILESGHKTYFSGLEYAEQTDTIYSILENLYPEITKDNVGVIENYDTTLSPVRNKIVTSAIKNKKTDEYSLIFDIKDNPDDDEYIFIYNPIKNKITQGNLLDIVQDYIIISSKIHPNIPNIENIDEKNPTKK